MPAVLRGEFDVVPATDNGWPAPGNVVASSLSKGSPHPLTALRPRPGQVVTSPVSGQPSLDSDDRYLVVARGVAHASAAFVVVVAVSVSAQEETVATVATYLALGSVLLLGVVGGATYFFVSGSLRPVERMRRRVAEIDHSAGGERVPVPTSGDEIARLAQTMNSMLDRLQSAHAAQQRFVADASHELRSPLATLRVSLDIARADPTHESWPELHETMAAEAERMGHLVADLLLLAKVDEDGLLLSPTDVDLDDLLTAEVARLKATTELKVTADIVAVRAFADRGQLSQVLRNLTDNAARYARSKIEMDLSTTNTDAVIHVDDDGHGIPADDRKRIFERFVRLDSSRERSTGGSGLGLAIAEEILTRHGGTITAEDSPIGGARFTVRIPLTTQPTVSHRRGRGGNPSPVPSR